MHRGLRVAVLPFVSYDQHRRIIRCSLHVFPRWAPSDATALVISPENFNTTAKIKNDPRNAGI